MKAVLKFLQFLKILSFFKYVRLGTNVFWLARFFPYSSDSAYVSYQIISKGVAKGGPGVPVPPPFASPF